MLRRLPEYDYESDRERCCATVNGAPCHRVHRGCRVRLLPQLAAPVYAARRAASHDPRPPRKSTSPTTPHSRSASLRTAALLARRLGCFSAVSSSPSRGGPRRSRAAAPGRGSPPNGRHRRVPSRGRATRQGPRKRAIRAPRGPGPPEGPRPQQALRGPSPGPPPVFPRPHRPFQAPGALRPPARPGRPCFSFSGPGVGMQERAS